MLKWKTSLLLRHPRWVEEDFGSIPPSFTHILRTDLRGKPGKKPPVPFLHAFSNHQRWMHAFDLKMRPLFHAIWRQLSSLKSPKLSICNVPLCFRWKQAIRTKEQMANFTSVYKAKGVRISQSIHAASYTQRHRWTTKPRPITCSMWPQRTADPLHPLRLRKSTSPLSMLTTMSLFSLRHRKCPKSARTLP